MLAGCASYAPQPLDGGDVDAVLASPDRAALTQRAAATHAAIRLDFTQPLTGEEIAVLAVLANPDLRAARIQQRIAEAQVFAAGLLPDPQLSLGFDRVLAPSGQNLVTAFTGGLTLDLLSALATRGVMQQAQRAASEQVRLDIAWLEATTAAQAQLLAERLPRQQAAATLAQHADDRAAAALARALKAAARGDLKADEIEIRRIAASDAHARALTLARDAEATRLALNAELGLRPGELLALAEPAALPPWSPADAEALFATARHARLDLQALARGYDSQEASLHRAVLGQYPKLGITLTRARDTSAVHTFGPAVSFDIPLWNRNRGEILLADLAREKLRAEYAARLFQTRADIAALVSALDRDEQARAALAVQRSSLDTIAARFEAAALRGDVALPVAEAARASAIDKQLEWLALDQSCAEQRLALAMTVGAPMTAAAVSESTPAAGPVAP